MALRFEHRDTEVDVSLVDRVWRTRSDAEETMTSAAGGSFRTGPVRGRPGRFC